MKPKLMMAGLLLCFLANSLASANNALGPEELVDRTAGSLMNALSEKEDEFRANPDLLEDLVREDLLPLLDVKYSARLILGRAGRGATSEQLEAFAEAMSELLISRYATGLLEYRNREQLQIMPLRGELNEKMTRVRTRVQLTSGKYIPIDYVFRKTEDGWKAFDVIVEGISYVTTYRNQIMPEIQEDGLDSVIERLNEGELMIEE